MSTTAADHSDLDLREQIVRIDRTIAETQKFQAEIRKMHRDRFLAPFVVVFAGLAGLGATIGPVLVHAAYSGHP